MAIELNLGNPSKTTSGKGERKQAKVWINVGIPYTDPDTGEVTFVSLGGIPVDVLELQPINGSTEDYRKVQQAKNQLLEMAQTAGAEMEPGEEYIIEGLQAQIRRTKEAEAPIAKDNELMGGFAKLGFKRKAA